MTVLLVELDRSRAQMAGGELDQPRVGRGGEPRTGACGAASAVAGVGVVELLLQHPHQAASVGAEVGHRRLF